MKITEIHVSAFGKLKNFNIQLSDGFNIILGENEAGKSTLMAFIKLAFFGSAARGDTLANPRFKYKPQDNAAPGGTVKFTHGGKNYALECHFGASPAKDKIILTDLDMGQIIKLPAGQTAGEYFLNISGDTFERTAFVGNVIPEKGGDEIANKLSAAGNCDGPSPQKVLENIEKGREKQFAKRGKSGIADKLKAEIIEKQQEITKQINRAKTVEDVQNQIARKQAQIQEYNDRRQKLAKLIEQGAGANRKAALKELVFAAKNAESAKQALKGADKAFADNCRRLCWEVTVQNDRVNEAQEKLNTALDVMGLSEEGLELAKQARNAADKPQRNGPLILGAAFTLLGVCLTCAAIFTLKILLAVGIPAAVAGVVLLVVALANNGKKANGMEREKAEKLVLAANNRDKEEAKLKDMKLRFVMEISKFAPAEDFDKAVAILADIDKKLEELDRANNSRVTLENTLGVDKDTAKKELETLPADDITPEALQGYKDELAGIDAKLPVIIDGKATLTAQLSADKDGRKGVAALQLELEEMEKSLESRIKFAKAAMLAENVMQEAYATLRQSFMPELTQETVKLFSEITGQKYINVNVAHDLSLTAQQAGSAFNMQSGSLSAGTQDAVYLSLRLAMVKLLGKGEIPAFLDDSLLQLDDKREQMAINALCKAGENGQLLLFTCKKATALKAGDNGANIIAM